MLKIYLIVCLFIMASASKLKLLKEDKKCQVPNCLDCKGDISQCKTCKDGYYYHKEANNCEPCDVFKCKQCISKHICNQCISGNYFDSIKKKCLSCTIKKCKSCTSKSDCTSCEKGWEVDSDLQICKMNSKLHKRIILYLMMSIGILGLLVLIGYLCFKLKNLHPDQEKYQSLNEGKIGKEIEKKLTNSEKTDQLHN